MWGGPFCKKGLPTPLSKNFHILFVGQSSPQAKTVRQKVIEVLVEVTTGNSIAIAKISVLLHTLFSS